MNFYDTYGWMTFNTTINSETARVTVMPHGVMFAKADTDERIPEHIVCKYSDMTQKDVEWIKLMIEDYRIQCEQAQQQQYEYEAALRAYERAQERYQQAVVNHPDYTF